jgi:hypothetical protein
MENFFKIKRTENENQKYKTRIFKKYQKKKIKKLKIKN